MNFTQSGTGVRSSVSGTQPQLPVGPVVTPKAMFEQLGEARGLPKKRAHGMRRNPATGEPIQIKASKKVGFRAAGELKQAV